MMYLERLSKCAHEGVPLYRHKVEEEAYLDSATLDHAGGHMPGYAGDFVCIANWLAAVEELRV